MKRSRGGSDFDLDRLVALCRACHDQTDAPWVKGRLVITLLGGGRFVFDTVTLTRRSWDRLGADSVMPPRQARQIFNGRTKYIA
jgi:hypothetical protein